MTRAMNLRFKRRKMSILSVVALFVLGLFPPPAASQQAENPVPKAAPPATTGAQGDTQSATSAASSPLRLTLQDVLNRARAINPAYQSAQTEAGVAKQDRFQAGTALLPSVNYENQALYSQGAPAAVTAQTNVPVVFIANNAVHEYVSQANVHETIDFAGVANFRKASANSALARARAEIASRGLVVTVVQTYYTLAAAKEKMDTAKQAAEEGQNFLKLTEDLEKGGEVAHSDVIKADLQATERQRQYQEAQLAYLNARLDLAVLIFPNFNENFEIADDLHSAVALPTLDAVKQRAAQENPDIRAAVEAERAAGEDVLLSRAGYLPTLGLDYWYGIDAPNFGVNFPTQINGKTYSNLGSSISATLNIPIWNWGATQSRVKQAELRRTQAKRELSFAQRKLLAEIQSLYAEADTALNELSGLSRSSELAAESLRLTTMRYKAGEATVLEVVDAQTTAAQANAAYQDGAVRYRVALANLQTLTGELTTP
ncbi:MAG TPA: TolC family protein [Candidatus Acidoferrum sp.]|nr:TolC family protein [Candidatus Acidoferrum sp.]